MASQEGSTPAIGDDQARALLAAQNGASLKGLRDHAIVATLLYHGLHRAELCALHLVDLHERRGVCHLKVHSVNFVLLLAWGYFSRFSEIVFWGMFVYQDIGLFVLRLVRVPAAPVLVGLNGNDRFWLRVFYAWLWPLYVPFLLFKK